MSDLTAQRKLDLTGQICPWPVINTMRELKRMNAGEVVEVLIYHAPSVQNIPEAAKRDGHQIVNTEPLGDGIFRIIIRAERKV